MSDITFSDTDTLSLVEKNNLQYHEQVIQKGLASFIEVGESLMAIREGKLYRAEFGTFENYCKVRWGISKRHANRLIGAKELQDEMGPIGPKIQTESQARELAKVPTEKRQEVIERTIEKEGKLTAASIKDMAQQLTEEREPEVVTTTVESTAMQQAAKAISALLEVSTQDPMHDDAMRKVRQFCNRRLKYENA